MNSRAITTATAAVETGTAVQAAVARRFDRERCDAEQLVASFSGRLQAAVDLGRVTDELGAAVGTALRPTTVALWFSDGERAR